MRAIGSSSYTGSAPSVFIVPSMSPSPSACACARAVATLASRSSLMLHTSCLDMMKRPKRGASAGWLLDPAAYLTEADRRAVESRSARGDDDLVAVLEERPGSAVGQSQRS